MIAGRWRHAIEILPCTGRITPAVRGITVSSCPETEEMNMMRGIGTALIVVMGGLLAACATPGSSLSKPDLSQISVGMSKEEVISRLGKPHEVAQQGQTEYFTYNFDHPFDGRPAIVESYYVRFAAGRVESYGRKGDFDSTKDPAVDVRVSEESKAEPCDLYVELKKLEELRNDGLLTDEEFQAQKKKVLEECG